LIRELLGVLNWIIVKHFGYHGGQSSKWNFIGRSINLNEVFCRIRLRVNGLRHKLNHVLVITLELGNAGNGMKRVIVVTIVLAIGIGIALFITKSIPYSDREELLSAKISIDSVWSLGPETAIYDKSSRQFYWLKSYTSFDQSMVDTLKSKTASIRYMKFFEGPLENRIYRMEVDSVVVFDQVIDRKQEMNKEKR